MKANSEPREDRKVRALGVDLGTRRIGLAICDSRGLVALPLKVLERCSSEADDHAAIAEVAAERNVEHVVVGMPISLDGSRGPSAAAVAAEVERLKTALDTHVHTQDERLSTVAAERSLRSGDLSGRRRREVVDMVAATILLQSWLDSLRHRPLPQA